MPILSNIFTPDDQTTPPSTADHADSSDDNSYDLNGNRVDGDTGDSSIHDGAGNGLIHASPEPEDTIASAM